MKTLRMMLIASLVMLATMAVKAQEKKSDFFVGKWATVTVGTPGGDGKGMIVLSRTPEGKMAGYSCAANGEGEKTIFSRVDEKEKSVTVYFKARGYDVYIFLEKVDENNLSGSTMDMFDTTAKRIVESAATPDKK